MFPFPPPPPLTCGRGSVGEWGIPLDPCSGVPLPGPGRLQTGGTGVAATVSRGVSGQVCVKESDSRGQHAPEVGVMWGPNPAWG